MARKRKVKSHIVGVGYDQKDEHVRITKADGLTIVGGSKETHEQMQEQGIKLGEEAAKRGKTLDQLSSEEARDIMEKVLE